MRFCGVDSNVRIIPISLKLTALRGGSRDREPTFLTSAMNGDARRRSDHRRTVGHRGWCMSSIGPSGGSGDTLSPPAYTAMQRLGSPLHGLATPVCCRPSHPADLPPHSIKLRWSSPWAFICWTGSSIVRGFGGNPISRLRTYCGRSFSALAILPMPKRCYRKRRSPCRRFMSSRAPRPTRHASSSVCGIEHT